MASYNNVQKVMLLPGGQWVWNFIRAGCGGQTYNGTGERKREGRGQCWQAMAWNYVCIVSMRGSQYSDSLRAGRSGDPILVEVRFSAPVQTGSEAHLASYTMGIVPFLGVQRPGRGTDHSPPSSAEVKEGVKLYATSPVGLCGLF